MVGDKQEKMFFEYDDDVPNKKDLLEDDDDDEELLLGSFRPGSTSSQYRLKRMTDEQIFARNCRVIVPYDEEQVNKNNAEDSDEELLERSKSVNLDERRKAGLLIHKGHKHYDLDSNAYFRPNDIDKPLYG